MVGDDDQSIYGWRGADIRKILGFHRDFEGAKVVRLQTNYRSTRPILDAANAVIRHNASRHDKALESARGEGAEVRFAQLKDETSEAQFVVGEIAKVTKPGRARPGDFAVLCRTQVQFRPFEVELRAAGLPYVVVGGMSFFDRKEVRDVVAYLKLAVNPRDETSLLRVINTPPRGVGKASIDKVLDFATRHGIPASEAFDRAGEIDGLSPQSVEGYRALRATLERADLAEAGRQLVDRLSAFLGSVDYRAEVARLYADPMTREARWAGVEEILNFAENYVRRSPEPTLGRVPRGARAHAAATSRRRSRSGGDAVTLMTLHAAKGLEFPHVFLVGMEEGLLPHARAAAEGGVEEERRLAYVGITRAMTTLTLSWAFERAKYGRRVALRALALPVRGAGRGPPAGLGGRRGDPRARTDDLPPAGRGKKKAGRAKAGAGKAAKRKPRSR